MSTKAIFIATDAGYLKYTNALLNSLDACGSQVPVHLMVYNCGLKSKYIEQLMRQPFVFPVHIQEMKQSELQLELERYRLAVGREPSNNHLVKTMRMKYMMAQGMCHDSICLLDADMIVVSPNFTNLMDIVVNTDWLVGCNEGFKWNIGPEYTLDDKPLFDPPRELHWFHCSVPIIFSMPRWKSVFEEYLKIFYGGLQLRKGNKEDIGDMFSYNIAVARCSREKDLLLLPSHQMTQVHMQGYLPWCSLQGKMGRMIARKNNEEVYVLHGRPFGANWGPGIRNNVEKTLTGIRMEKAAIDDWLNVELPKITGNVQKMWTSMANDHKVKGCDYEL